MSASLPKISNSHCSTKAVAVLSLHFLWDPHYAHIVLAEAVFNIIHEIVDYGSLLSNHFGILGERGVLILHVTDAVLHGIIYLIF